MEPYSRVPNGSILTNLRTDVGKNIFHVAIVETLGTERIQ